MSLVDELRMNKPFSSVQEEVLLSILKTAEVLESNLAEQLKPSELSSNQYNVLRILRGSSSGLSCGEIAERMITRDPDITRLLDRLHQQGLVSRERSQQDRRVVKASITAEGLQVLEALDPVLASSRANLSEGFSEKELTNLVQYLERVRRNVAG